ncbi:MAG: hypothetical protein FWD61_04300 [Phycisphaerales bacterium]|nr:hypothetical protein [Phycisphaerales bacterium]
MIGKILKNFGLALLLIMPLTLSAAWLRSYWVLEEFYWRSPHYARLSGICYEATIGSERGGIYYTRVTDYYPTVDSSHPRSPFNGPFPSNAPDRPYPSIGYVRRSVGSSSVGLLYTPFDISPTYKGFNASPPIRFGPDRSPNWRYAGFNFRQESISETSNHFRRDWHFLVVPYWAPIVLLSLPLWFFVARWRKANEQHQRRKNNLCLHCGYDLRAHHPGDKCPECGTRIPQPNPAIIGNERSRP